MSASYPATCRSEHCGQILCDGCKNREAHRSYYVDKGEAERWERGQDALRAHKKAMTGPFSHLKPPEKPHGV